MADTEWVLIEYPGIDGTALVADRSLNHWRARGWTVAPDPPKPARTPKVPAAPAAPAPPTAAPKPADNPKDEG